MVPSSKKRIKRGVRYMSYNIIIAQEKEKDKLPYFFLKFFLKRATKSSANKISAIINIINSINGKVNSLIKKNENFIMFSIIIFLPFLVVH